MKELLTVLTTAAKCTYISDLPLSYKLRLQRSTVALIDSTFYSIDEWNEAISYISKKRCSFSSADEAKSFLCSLIDEN